MQSQESEALQARYRLACELAKAGAELAFEYYQQREALTVDHKGDDLQDVVSVADKRVEAFVKQRIQSAFPEDGFLGEESGARLPDARVLWVVDPIDGTSCFLNGLHTWCLSLAIVADGEPVIGVVYDLYGSTTYCNFYSHVKYSPLASSVRVIYVAFCCYTAPDIQPFFD